MPDLTADDRASLRTSLVHVLQRRTDAAERTGSGQDLSQAWAELGALGWLGLGVPEQFGGFGYAATVQSILAEESAVRLCPLPLFASIGLSSAIAVATNACGLLDRLVNGATRASVAWASPSGSGRFSDPSNATSVWVDPTGRLRGEKAWVPNVQEVDQLIVVAHDGSELSLWLVDRTERGVQIRACDQIDEARPLSRVRFDVLGERLATGDVADRAMEFARRRASVWVTAEAVGVAREALRIGCEHATQRRQFTRLIGEYQGVSHALAELYADLELSRSALAWSASALDAETCGPATPDADASDAETAIQCALAMALPTAASAAEKAMQVLGGQGMAWESEVHRYYKRALWLATFDGSAGNARHRLADTILGSVAS